MSAGLLFYVALVITLAAVVGVALDSLCRCLGRPARWAWLGASVMAFMLVVKALLTKTGAPVAATYSRIALPEASTVAPAGWSPWQAVRDAVGLSTAAIGSFADSVIRAVPHAFITVATAFCIATSLVALVVLTLVHLRIRRARRAWAETELFGTRVRIAPDVGPAVVGMMRPQIVVPSWLLGRSVDEQLLVLAHEREHLTARDHLLLGAGSLVVALVPWHPAAWWMLARLRLAIELDCDARVLRRGVPARTYGTLLIDLADRCTGFRVGATALADEGSHLERRLLAMKTTGTKRSPTRAGVLGAAAALALLAACEAKVPTGPEINAMDVASAQRTAAHSQMFKSLQADSVTYVVDGKQVDAKTANSLTPNQIASVDVNKISATRALIRIATNGQAADTPHVDGLARMHASMHGTGTLSSKSEMRTASDPAHQPLILIDGVKASDAQMKALDPRSIESIEVLKGIAAEKLSADPAAKNGIIQVTTKK